MTDEALLNLFETLLIMNNDHDICIEHLQYRADDLAQIVREAIKWRLAEAG